MCSAPQLFSADESAARVELSASVPPAKLISQARTLVNAVYGEALTPHGTLWTEHVAGTMQILTSYYDQPIANAAALVYLALCDKWIEAEALQAKLSPGVCAMATELVALTKTLRQTRAGVAHAEHTHAEIIRQMIFTSTRDLRVLLILLANRTQTLREFVDLHQGGLQQNPLLSSQEDLAQLAIKVANETFMVFAPLAHRLGVISIKNEMEDLAFALIQPAAYHEIKDTLSTLEDKGSLHLTEINTQIDQLLSEQSIKAQVQGRTKHLYSVYNKIKRRHVELEHIHDLVATRVITDDISDCYRVLGLIHKAFTPLPGRFKDYIALPKNNGYQSLHTTVISPTLGRFEVQIRTQQMDNLAELGMAAHFHYKEQLATVSSEEIEAKIQTDSTEKSYETAFLHWSRVTLDSLRQDHDGAGGEPVMSFLQHDLMPQHIFVFTPKGQLIKLPPRATSIDFAYAIHSEVGEHCTHARMDGKIISLRAPLKNGSVVDILTDTKQSPKLNWLKHTVSHKAQSKIKAYLRKQGQEENIEQGKIRFQREARKQGWSASALLRHPPFESWMNRQVLSEPHMLYAAVGEERFDLAEVLAKFPSQEAISQDKNKPANTLPSSVLPTAETPQRPKKGVYVEGMQGVAVRFARCCSQVQGDPLMGVLNSSGRVSVHHQHCSTLMKNRMNRPLMDVYWEQRHVAVQRVPIVITSEKSLQVLMELMIWIEQQALAKVLESHVVAKDSQIVQHLTVEVSTLSQLETLLEKINARPHCKAKRVMDATRREAV